MKNRNNLLIVIVILAVIASMTAMASCSRTGEGEPTLTAENSAENSAETPSESAEKETDKEKPETDHTVFKGKEWNFKLIRPDNSYAGVTGICSEFYKKLTELSGESPDYKTDIIYRGQSIDPAAHELLVGLTNREESVKITEKTEKAGGERFGIYTTENKIAVSGTNTYATYLGLEYVLDNFVKTDANGGKIMEIPKKFEYISDDMGDKIPDFKEASESGAELAFYTVKKVVSMGKPEGFPTMQGGGTDGKYAYYGFINKDNENAIIMKYDLATWELVKTSDPIPTGHTNDIAYDPINKRLVISYCTTKDNYCGMCFVDAETLEFQSYFLTPVPQRAVEYLPATGQYLLGTNYYFTLVDADLKTKLSSFNCGSGRYTTQGMCADDRYVYDVRWRSGSTVQTIVVHGLNGKYFGEIDFLGVSGEPENMFRLGNRFYVGCNGTNCVYEVELLPKKFK